MRARERSPWRERVQGEKVCTGGREFESETRGSQTRESRRVYVTNAGFKTRVQVRTRGERRREHELHVALTQEEHRRGHELRAALIQERVSRVKQMPRTRRLALGIAWTRE